MVVLLVDLLDASGSFLNHVRDLVGGNPVLLIGTKVRTPLRSIRLLFPWADTSCARSHGL